MKETTGSLRTGCYLMSFKPNAGGDLTHLKSFIGTLRITSNQSEAGADEKVTDKAELKASGDLYSLSSVLGQSTQSLVTQLPNFPQISISDAWRAKALISKSAIPIPHFEMDAYRYYLEIHAVDASQAGRLSLETTAHDYDSESRTLKPRSRMQIVLKSQDDGQTYEGPLVNGEEERGTFYLQWISNSVRRAELRMFAITPRNDSEAKVIFPGSDIGRMTKALVKASAASKLSKKSSANKAIPDWQELFKAIQWDLKVTKISGGDLEHTPDSWAAYDLSEAARTLRQEQAQKKPKDGKPSEPHGWFYDLLCVSKFESQFQSPTQGGNYLGIMFDTEATDLNQQPRESAAVAALQPLRENGKEVNFQDVLGGAAYYRTALHEVGHAMNLPHNLQGDSLMNTTGLLIQLPNPATDLYPAVPLRFDVDWRFSPEDAQWLQHASDLMIRPGGISRRGARLQQEMRPPPPPLSLQAASDMVLSVSPVLDTFPFGAPVRFNYTLGNRGLKERLVPRDVSLRGGHVMGRVTGPDRVTRFFRSAFRCCDTAGSEDRLRELKAGESFDDSLTILRGIDGPLFPDAGAYEVELEIRWDADDQTHRITGRSFVTVKGADDKDPAQAIAATLILNDTTMMPPLVQGLIDSKGLRALSVALRSPTLAAHYLTTALRCMIKGRERQVDWNDESKLGGPVSPVSLAKATSDTAAPARIADDAPARFNTSTSPGEVNRIIVQTNRERKQLQEKLPQALPPGEVGTTGTDSRQGYENVVLPAETEEWIQGVHDFTIPPSVGGADTPSGDPSRPTSAQKPVSKS